MRARWLGWVLAAALVLPAMPLGEPGPWAAGGARAAPVSRDQSPALMVDGRKRTYDVHVPPRGAGAAGRPVVLAFHGGYGTGSGMAGLTHLNAVADRLGFVAVYPDGIGRGWNDGRGSTPAERRRIDDVAFVARLIDQLVQDFGVDERRVFATGISNGSMFAERLGCELAGRPSGIAPVAGALPAGVAGSSCRPVRPLAVLLVHGDQDPLVPYAGGSVRGRGGGGSVTSVAETGAFWRSRAGCTGTTATLLPDVTDDDGTRVRVERGTGCAPAAPVTVYSVVAGGHTWPGGRQYLPAAVVGRTSRDLDASEAILGFFASVPPT